MLTASVIHASIYDYPEHYDLLFGDDWRDEYRFLRAAFRRYATRPVERVFEPACGTGRLLVRLAQAGFEVAGNDLNPRAVEFCNARLRRSGFPATAVVADMSRFRLRRPVDAAFNLINSFRHLGSEAAARGHLECMARALAPGGIYLLGLHLTPTAGRVECDEECWTAVKGRTVIDSRMWTVRRSLARRRERIRMTFDVRSPGRQLILEDQFDFRTYTAAQMERLLTTVPALECVATHDFTHRIASQSPVTPRSEDVIYVLRKRAQRRAK